MKQLHGLVLGDSSQNLLVLHGFLGMGDNWKTHAKRWAEQGWRVHLIDLRNHGRSFWSDEFNYEVMSEDILQYCKNNGLNSITLLGHSMGGKVAMMVASLHPQLVNRLIVADIAPKAYAPHHQSILAGLSSLDFSMLSKRQEADHHLSSFVKDIGTRQFLLKNIYRVTPTQLGLRLNIDVLKNAGETIGSSLPSTLSYKGKTLFLKGEKSGYIDENDSLSIRYHFPEAELITIPNAGHWLHAENPKDFLNELEQWLSA